MELIRSSKLGSLLDDINNSCKTDEEQEDVCVKFEKLFYFIDGYLDSAFHNSVIIGTKIAEVIKPKEKIYYHDGNNGDIRFLVVAKSEKKALEAVRSVFKVNK